MEKKKKKITTVAAVLLILLIGVLLATFVAAPRIADKLAEKQVEEYLESYPDRPESSETVILRGEFAALLAYDMGLEGHDSKGVGSYDDTHGHWAEPFIETLVEYGVLESGGDFLPDQPISRMDCIRMIVHSMGKEQEVKLAGGQTAFLDDAEIAEEDKGYVNIAQKYDITHGFTDNLVRPADDTTWGEAIEMLLRRAAAVKQVEDSQDEKTDDELPAIPSKGSNSSSSGTPGKPAWDNSTSTKPPASIETPVIQPEPEPKPEAQPEQPPETKPDSDSKPSKPSRPSGGGSSGHSAAQVELQGPEYSYIDQSFTVNAICKHVRSLSWSITDEKGVQLPEGSYTASLDKTGGSVQILQPGTMVITAEAENYGGRKYTFSKTITIHPILEIEVSAPNYTHTDGTFAVKTKLSDNVTQQLNWRLLLDGKEVKWQDHMEGTLNNTGGSIRLLHQGNYTLRAAAYDATGREYYGVAKIISLPVVSISLDVPSAIHTDTAAQVTAQIKNLGDTDVVWSLERDGAPVDLDTAAEHTLCNEGGRLRILQNGQYSLRAVVKDISGREFSQSVPISVYPVASIAFSLPEIAHTDEQLTVHTQITEQQGQDVIWSLTKDAQPLPLETALDGGLQNEGGEIRFTEPGSYVLTATLTDPIGRSYTHSEKIQVYPVVDLGFYLPNLLHPDETAVVEAKFAEADGLLVEWSLKKDGQAVSLTDYVEGELTNDGGKIRFKETGEYELSAAATDGAGRSFTGKRSLTVLPIIELELNAPAYTHTDIPADVTLQTVHAGQLPVVWTIAPAEGGAERPLALAAEGGSVSITEKGQYVITASITDESGRIFSANREIQVYPVPSMKFSLPEAVHTDYTIHLETECSDMDGLTAEWKVDNTYGFQNWDTYVDGTLRNNGGNIRFRRAGVYDLQAQVTDETGRVFLFNSGRIEVLPVLYLTFELPDTGYTDTEIDLRTRGNIGVLPVEWSLMRNGEPVSQSAYVDGSLNAQGGKIRFTSLGEYQLTATMFDALGRVFTHSQNISIYPILSCDFVMPQQIHTGQEFVVALSSTANLNGLPVHWSLQKDGDAVALGDFLQGNLSDSGGKVHIDHTGVYTLKAEITDELDRRFTCTQTIRVTNTAPAVPTLTVTPSRTYQDGKFFVQISASATDPDGDPVTYEFEGRTDGDYYTIGSHTIRARAKDPYGGVSEWAEFTFEVKNTAPTKPALKATVTRTSKDGAFRVNFTLTPSSDPDGDPITYEYENKKEYYPVGTHTVRVRASDGRGGVSDWASVTFAVSNSAPSRPVITRTPDGNSVAPGTPVTLRAKSSDPDGDAITYVWEGRTAETAVYPLGKHTVRVKAVDKHGAESPWAAIVFFVMDSNGTGGMMLTGPSSTILEEGLEDATITEYTFTVPPVSGHNGNDYGRVRGYNIKTGKWDQLDYQKTNNGITFTRTLPAGTYSKLEMYYYTNHDCMYNKSNITYSVTYYFE